MKIIHKKVDNEYLCEVAFQNKTFELRKDDDNARVGDVLHLVNNYYSSEEHKIDQRLNIVNPFHKGPMDIFAEITYILRNYKGLKKGYAIYGIKVISEVGNANTN